MSILETRKVYRYRQMVRQLDRKVYKIQIYEKTVRQIGTQKGRWKDSWIERQMERQLDRKIDEKILEVKRKQYITEHLNNFQREKTIV